MTIRNQIGPYISACIDVIDKLARQVAPDKQASKRLKVAFQDISSTFFSNPDNFKFRRSVKIGLKHSGLGEDMNELVAILQGRSEMIPLVGVKTDGEGNAYEGFSSEELLELRSEICSGVALKINTVVSELDISKKREALAEEGREISESRKTARLALEARIAVVRARQDLRTTEAGCIQLVTENGFELENLDLIFQNNKNVVLAAVIQNGRALQFAHSRLRNDNDVVREALKHPDSDFIIEHAGDAFRENRAQLLEAIRNNEMAIGYGNDELVEDREFMLDAIDTNPMVIQLFDESLRNNREIVIRALKSMNRIDDPEILLQVVGNEIRPFADAYCRVLRNPMDLEHLDEVFRNDREVVLMALRIEDSRVLRFVGEEIRLFAEAYCRMLLNPHDLADLDEALKNNRDIVLAAVNKNGNVLANASETLKNNRDIVLAAVDQDGNALQFASKVLRDNREIVLAAVRQNGFALQYASEALRNDREIVMMIVFRRMNWRDDPEILLPFVGNEIRPFAEAYCRMLRDPMDLEHLDGSFRNDRDIVLVVVRRNGNALQYASEALRNDPEIIAEAERHRGPTIEEVD